MWKHTGEEVAGVLLKKLPALLLKEDPPETMRQRRCLHCKPRCSPLGKAIRRHCCCDGRMRNQPPMNRDIAISRWNKHWIKVTAMIRTFQIVESIFSAPRQIRRPVVAVGCSPLQVTRASGLTAAGLPHGGQWPRTASCLWLSPRPGGSSRARGCGLFIEWSSGL